MRVPAKEGKCGNLLLSPGHSPMRRRVSSQRGWAEWLEFQMLSKRGPQYFHRHCANSAENRGASLGEKSRTCRHRSCRSPPMRNLGGRCGPVLATKTYRGLTMASAKRDTNWQMDRERTGKCRGIELTTFLIVDVSASKLNSQARSARVTTYQGTIHVTGIDCARGWGHSVALVV